MSYPSYVTVTPAGNAPFTWAASTTDLRGTQRASVTNDRIAACWYSFSSFSVDLNFTDGKTHQVAVYLLDWDGYLGRMERVDVVDASNTLLDTRTVGSFTGGQYLVWNLSGHVAIHFTNLSSSQTNAVMSAILFGS
jgi:hypothetical protein